MDHNIECHGKSDEELIPLILGNGDFYLCLMKRYEEKLLHYIKRISNSSKEDAEDILQDVFIKVYTNLNDFDQSLKFSSWIYRIAHNQVVSNFRKLQARPRSDNSEESAELIRRLADDYDMEKEMDLKYASRNISKILDSMDDKYKEVLVLKFLEEKDYQEISDILEKPIGTIGTLINRAKKKFREESLRSRLNF